MGLITGALKWLSMGYVCNKMNEEFQSSIGDGLPDFDLDPVAIVFNDGTPIRALSATKEQLQSLVVDQSGEFTSESLQSALNSIASGGIASPLSVKNMIGIGASMVVCFFLLQIFQVQIGGITGALGGQKERAHWGRAIMLGALGVTLLLAYPLFTGMMVGPCEAVAEGFGGYFSHARTQGIFAETVNQVIRQTEMGELQNNDNSPHAYDKALMQTVARRSPMSSMGNIVAEVLQVIAGAITWAAYGARQLILAIALLLGPLFVPFLVYDPFRDVFLGWMKFVLLVSVWKPIMVIETALVESLQSSAIMDSVVSPGSGDLTAVAGYAFLLIVLVIASPFTASALVKGAGLGMRSGVSTVSRAMTGGASIGRSGSSGGEDLNNDGIID